MKDKEGAITFSPIPEVDMLYNREICFEYKLPLSVLEKNCKKPKNEINGTMSKQKLKRILLTGVPSIIENETENKAEFFLCLKKEQKENSHKKIPINIINQNDLLKKIDGRQIAEGEMETFAKQINISKRELIANLQKIVLEGRGEWVPAVRWENGYWSCVRCGSKKLSAWPGHYGIVHTCEDCMSIGTLSSQQVIFRTLEDKKTKEYLQGNSIALSLKNAEGQKKIPKKIVKNFSSELDGDIERVLGITFSPSQASASKEICEWLEIGKEDKLLLWAACGAGKTEVCFPAVKEALRKEWKVLFAAPRKDVIRDVEERINVDYFGTKALVLYGGVAHQYKEFKLLAATTHQVLKFYKAFDLIILDEMDAFPYYGSEILEFGIRNALKDGGRVIYLTATPTDEAIKKAKNGMCKLVSIPARYHGHPLPVPKYLRLDLTKNFCHAKPSDSEQENKLKSVVNILLLNGKVLIFVPLISLVKQWTSYFSVLFPSENVAGSWSSDPNRNMKVDNLKSGKYTIFVSTMILERGITIPGVQVIVLYADHELFDRRILVQMAGRAGRTKEKPHGGVVFIALKKTLVIKNAVRQIEELNIKAKEEGLLEC